MGLFTCHKLLQPFQCAAADNEEINHTILRPGASITIASVPSLQIKRNNLVADDTVIAKKEVEPYKRGIQERISPRNNTCTL